MDDTFSLTETQSRILKAVISHETISDDCELKGVTSYQLSKTDPKIAIGTWNGNYKFLEDNMLIKKHSLNKDDGRGTKPYSITPIGITQLHNVTNMSSSLLDKILIFLKCEYLQGEQEQDKISYIKMFKEFCNEIETIYFDNDSLAKLFQDVLLGLRMQKDHDVLWIFIHFDNSYGQRTTLGKISLHEHGAKVGWFQDSEYMKISNTDNKGVDYLLSTFIMQAFSYNIISHLVVQQILYKSNPKKSRLIKNQLKKVPFEIFGIALEFQHRLHSAEMAHDATFQRTSTEIGNTFVRYVEANSEDIRLHRQEHSDKSRQFTAYDAVLDRIKSEKIIIKSKGELKKLMFETNAWKTKSDLNQFFRDFPKSIRKYFLEEFLGSQMYEKVFKEDIEMQKKWAQEREKDE